MLKLPNVPHFLKISLIKLRKVKSLPGKVISSLLAHKISILVLILSSLVVGILIQLRSNFITQTKIAPVSNSSPPLLSDSPVPESTEVASGSGSTPDSSVLGISTERTTNTPIYYPSPISNPTYPVYTPTPTPTPTPTATPSPSPSPSASTPTASPSVSTPASSSSSTRTCASLGVSPGVATAWYSQASTPQTVRDTATITIELRDCNNNIASVSDTLTISQSSGPGTTVNGSSPPISIEARNGQASFTVESQTSGTAVYIVRNTSKSFNVTDPNNKHPRITFNISAPTPTPTPTATPSPSPSPSASTPTASPTSNPSPNSSASPTPIPILTPSPSPI